ncbi:hypothetical protein CV093_12725 [Oceanobacillus sp. 143]|uniref:Aminoglycoside phosphotransferase domain-containing protein n=1 Tax=Oceanobacillus zhaokaii TaxID=2052660 RepID=A0A345PHW8_9BACI|nr:hypothetical protein [Oceanobacillus zhaokaii]AXI09598.1 hypothetical protein CUC15_11985 [Oceanobacillus zhaokaii]QGS68960.1 hypothetical protein CV093_12725 [Oceanobacillus sp. 143]
METVKRVLHAYGVYPEEIQEITSQLYRVYDGKNTYALKKSSLTVQTISQWEYVYKQANIQHLTGVVPVYLTVDGNLFKELNEIYYYLSPWIEESNSAMTKPWLDNVFINLATIHEKTKKTQSISKGNLKKHFTNYQTYCEQAKKDLLKMIIEFEKSRYMSPFELQACTQYRDLEYALNESSKRIGQFIDSDDEEINWNTSLCHRNLNQAHLLSSFIINWERATYDNPVNDLVSFFHSAVGNYDGPSDKLIELFPTYNEINRLSMPEHHFLIIYLLDPTNYIKLIHSHHHKATKHSMIHQVQSLQKEYRKLIFGLGWSAYIEKEFETIRFEDLGS